MLTALISTSLLCASVRSDRLTDFNLDITTREHLAQDPSLGLASVVVPHSVLKGHKYIFDAEVLDRDYVRYDFTSGSAHGANGYYAVTKADLRIRFSLDNCHPRPNQVGVGEKKSCLCWPSTQDAAPHNNCGDKNNYMYVCFDYTGNKLRLSYWNSETSAIEVKDDSCVAALIHMTSKLTAIYCGVSTGKGIALAEQKVGPKFSAEHILGKPYRVRMLYFHFEGCGDMTYDNMFYAGQLRTESYEPMHSLIEPYPSHLDGSNCIDCTCNINVDLGIGGAAMFGAGYVTTVMALLLFVGH